MIFRRSLIACLLFVLFFACKDKPSGSKVLVSGEMKNFDSMKTVFPTIFTSDSIKLFLYEVPFMDDQQPVQVDSVYVTSKNPKFTLEAQASKMGLYDVMID